MSRQRYLSAAAAAEARGDNETAALLRKLAGPGATAPAPLAPPPSEPPLLGGAPAPSVGEVEIAAVEAQQQAVERTLPQMEFTEAEIAAKGREAAERLRAPSTVAGARSSDAGLFRESRIIPGTALVVDEETGAAREASSLELVGESLRRQTVLEATSPEDQRRIEETRRAAEENPLLAATVEFAPNRLVETPFMQTMRNLGWTEAALGNIIFDQLPLFYEVDEQGNLQNPDDLGDQFAKAASEALEKVAPGYARQPFLVPQGEDTGVSSLLAFTPRPFQAINRDSATSADTAGDRVSTYTGRMLADVALSAARGRSLGDEFRSIPAVDEVAGEGFSGTDLSALAFSVLIPATPFGVAEAGAAVTRTLAADEAVDAALEMARRATSPTAWGEAVRLQRASNDLLIEAGGKPVTVLEAFEAGADVRRRVADTLGSEVATPYAMLAPLDRAELQGIAGTSRSGAHILRRAGLDAPGPQLLTEDEVDALTRSFDEWRIGAEMPTLERMAFEGGQLNDNFARDPVGFFRSVVTDGAGVERVARLATTAYAPVLGDAARLARKGGLTPDQARAVLGGLRRVATEAGSTPIGTKNPFLRTAFGFADETTRRPFASRLAGGYKSPLATEHRVAPVLARKARDRASRAALHRAALARAISTGARDVLGNIVPEDMVFVTDRLMVNRARWSPEVAGNIRRAVANNVGATPTGRGTVSINAAAVRNAIGAADGYRQRLPVARTLTARLGPGVAKVEVTPDEARWVADTLAEARWRQQPTARPAVFQGPQAQRAQRPSIETREGRFEARLTLTDRVARVADLALLADEAVTRAARTAQASFNVDVAPMFRRASETTVGKALTNWYRDYRVNLTPAPFGRMMSELTDQVPLISRSFAREVVEARRAAEQAGTPNPGAAALNTVILRRFQREGDEAVERLDAAARDISAVPDAVVRELEAAGYGAAVRVPSEAARYAIAAYQTGFSGGPLSMAFGRVLYLVNGMEPDKQQRFIEVLRLAARTSAYEQQWNRLIESFFVGVVGGRQFDLRVNDIRQDIALHIAGAVRDPNAKAALQRFLDAQAAQAGADEVLTLFASAARAGVRPPTFDNFNAVVDELRKTSPLLSERGASKLTARGFVDATGETLVSWAMNSDKGALIRRKVADLLARHPELVVDLMPSTAWQEQTLLTLGSTRLAAGRRVVERLATLGRFDVEKAARSMAEPTTQVVDVYGARRAVGGKGAPLLANLDRYINLRLRNLSQTERVEILQTSLRSMLTSGNLYPELGTFRATTLTGSSGNRATLTAEIRAGITELATLRKAGTPPSNPAQRFMYDLVEGAMDQGYSIEDLVAPLADAVDEVVEEAVTAPIADQLRQTLRGYGFSSSRAIGAADKDALLSEFIGIDFQSPGVLAVGRDFATAMERLEVQAANGQLIAKLQDYQTRNIIAAQQYGDLAKYLLLEGLALSKQMASQGLLAAGGALQTVLPLPLIPNGRYLGVNLLTAPLIMLSTFGARRTGAALAEVPRTLVDMVTPRPANMPLFEDAGGTVWTKAKLEDAYSRANIYTTAADVDASASFLLDLFRDARVVAGRELRELSWASRALAEMDPRRTNLWMRFAIETDLLFRKSTFASALRDGMSEAQAAELARASVLDYGDIPDAVKQTVNRYILFASFQIASTKELLNALARDPETFIKVARLQYRQQQEAGAWAYGEDSARMRMVAVPAGTYDMVPAYLAGPQNPMLKAFGDLISVVGFASEVAAVVVPGLGEPVDLTGRFVEGALEQQIQPALQAGVAMATTGGAGAIGRVVPDAWVATLRTQPYVWTFVRDYCDIEEVPRAPFAEERRRPGAPTFEGQTQYQFTTREGYRRFQLLEFLAVQLRVSRTSQDVARTLAAGGVWEEGGDPKYRAAANPFFYYIGLQTPLRAERPEDIQRRALEQAQREIR